MAGNGKEDAYRDDTAGRDGSTSTALDSSESKMGAINGTRILLIGWTPANWNSQSSLTLIYQNNLNGSDDVNHASAIVLDPMPPQAAASACGALNENLLSQVTVQNYSTDFVDSLSYLNWKYSTGPSYLIDGAVVTVEKDQLSISTNPQPGPVPVLCTQSSRDSRPQNSSATSSNLVNVASGGNTYVGYRNSKSFRFNGIRYADMPERFEYSNLYSGKGETINATVYGSQCLQSGGSVGSEDCLFLNIQTPYIPYAKHGPSQKQHLRPVFFWIHGGGFTGGTGQDPGTDGGNLASREDIVVVTINYRLSTLGFLAVPGTDIKGNYGIGDQIVALQWVQQNIASFGGDPKKITIGGSSAGAGSVRAMADSNLGGGVTLGLDGNYGTTYSDYLTIEESYNLTGIPLLNATDCLATTGNSSTTAQADCLRTANATILITGNDVARYVVQDGTIVTTPQLTLTAGGPNPESAYVPIMFGIAANDGASFSNIATSPISNLSEGLQVGLGIEASYADSIISSVYAAAVTKSFPAVYYYQFDRSRDGYNPNNLNESLVAGPVSAEYPYGDPTSPEYFRLHGSTGPWYTGNWDGVFRDDGDLWSVQLVASYLASFVKTGNANPSVEELTVRGAAYQKVLEAVNDFGAWNEVEEGEAAPVRFLDWPASSGEWVDLDQCKWLNYSLEYYLQ
ncbi:Bile salt-activated lipase [Cyphellophora attinorum]|uniref:Carboxylic ester hydrolase n=1 Tax=Cyphellophora attinorum TaxID=1664694 RepID=A0A0N1HVR3_9EURO|nr:Bile salt-activated lipase [Phialophora attinorum]KPI43985.1 Bile salt-activated lipase [Phialophora attinorum]